ncbi:MAG: hypothetical protein QXR11_02555 [Zestosphaera sp.]
MGYLLMIVTSEYLRSEPLIDSGITSSPHIIWNRGGVSKTWHEVKSLIEEGYCLKLSRVLLFMTGRNSSE